MENINLPNENQTPSSITTLNNDGKDRNDAESKDEASPSLTIAHPIPLTDEVMKTTLAEVTNKISPPMENVREEMSPTTAAKINRSSNEIIVESSTQSHGIVRRWPPPKPPALVDEGRQVALSTAVGAAGNISPPPTVNIVKFAKEKLAISISSAAKLNENDADNNLESPSSSQTSPAIVSYTGKRWSPPKPPADEEKNQASMETTNKILPPSETIGQMQTLPPTVKVDNNDKESNVVVPSPTPSVAYIGKRWPPPKPSPSDEGKQLANKESTTVDIFSTDENNKGGDSESPPLSAYTGKRWPPPKSPADERNAAATTTAMKAVSAITMTATAAAVPAKVLDGNKLKRRWPPAPKEVDNDEEMESEKEEGNRVDGASGDHGVLSEYRTSVEKLVCKGE